MARSGGGLGRLLRGLSSLAAGAVMLYLGYRFFSYSLGFLSADPPRVTAGLMAGLAGFTFTAGAVTLLRDWAVAERLAELLGGEERRVEQGEGGGGEEEARP